MIKRVEVERGRRIESGNKMERSNTKVVEKRDKAEKIRRTGRSKPRRKRSFESRDKKK